MSTVLEVESLSVNYGGVMAVAGVSLRVDQGQLVGLIGPNGAGKTTLIDAITGFTASEGTVRFVGREISGLAPHRRARLGLARTWQSVELFDDLTVREHLLLADEARAASPADRLGGTTRSRSERVAWALEAVGLTPLADSSPGELSHGQCKLVGIARALAGSPRLILLDEPAAGLDSEESRLLGVQLRRILDEDVGLLLIDHDVQLVATVCDYLYALDFGQVIAHGTCNDVLHRPNVQAYLGEDGAVVADQAVSALETRR
jgi:branched-chain amino acid transport system ATP-binding protein